MRTSTTRRVLQILGFLAACLLTESLAYGQAAQPEVPEKNPQPQRQQLPTQPPVQNPNRPLDALFSPDPLAPVLTPLYDLQNEADRDLGLRVTASYTFLYQYASTVNMNDHDLLSGRLDLGGEWTLFHAGKDTGSVGFLMRSGENIGRNQHFATGANVGDGLVMNSLQGNGKQLPVTLNLLYYRQSFFDDALAIYVGKLHPNQHIDLSPVANDETSQFLALPFDGNPSNPQEGNYSLGAAVEYQITKEIHANAVVIDAEGGPQTAFNTLHYDRFYEALELGYQPQVENLGKGFYRVVGWHNDTDGGEGSGVAFGFDQEIGGGWVPFGRYGWGDRRGTGIRELAAVGLANVTPFGRRGDMFGVAASWGDPSARGQRQEEIFETFYRLKVTDSVELSPDIEIINNPIFAPQSQTSVVFGLRLKIQF